MSIEKSDTSSKSEFEQQKQQNVDQVKLTAQRLVNQYRHADSFDEAFMKNLDKELSAVDSKVQAALSDILGGAVVRKYCEFLQKKNNPQATTETENPETEQVGYLPTPDQDKPLPDMTTSSPTASGITSSQIATVLKQIMDAHQAELEKILAAQSDSLSQLINNANQTTHEMASHQTDRLIHAIQKGGDTHYSDIIESSTAQTPVLVPDEMEGF